MTCDQAARLVEPYLDDELDAGTAVEIEEHLATCPACAAAGRQSQELRDGIRKHAPYYNAPPHLAADVRRSVRQAAREPVGYWRWAALAASLLLAVSLSWNIVQSRRTADPTAELIASHVRSLMGSHLLDVASSDQHNVKPWFAGKLDFSPDVRDLSGQGFPLVGGRVDYLDGRTVAALVFHRRQHVINLFTWPGAERDKTASRNGYNALRWTHGGMVYWAVSDVNLADLRRFAELYR